MASFTFYWSVGTWAEWEKKDNKSITYVAGVNRHPTNTFQPGDEVFIVCAKGMRLYLGGRLIVSAAPMSELEAQKALPNEALIKKDLYVLADTRFIDEFRAKLSIDADEVRALQFESGKNISSVGFTEATFSMDFNGPKRLTDQSAAVFRKLLSVGKESAEETEEDLLLESRLKAALAADDVEEVRALQSVKTRRGQTKFRKRLLMAYGGRCCITGCNVEHVLEAAHIHSHADETDYSTSNGLLLRADIHTLFDLNLLGIDEFGRIRMSQRLKDSEYWRLNGQRIASPDKQENYPSRFFLQKRLQRIADL